MAKIIKPKTDLEYHIVNLVKERRIKLERTQEDVAKELNVTRGYIGQIEMQKYPSMYTYDQLSKLAEYLGCSMRDFIPKNTM